MTSTDHTLDRLFSAIAARKGADPKSSYTAKLFAQGAPKIAQKLGEEAVETVIAALTEERAAVTAESADLLYHLLVLWVERGVTPRMSGPNWRDVKAYRGWRKKHPENRTRNPHGL